MLWAAFVSFETSVCNHIGWNVVNMASVQTLTLKDHAAACTCTQVSSVLYTCTSFCCSVSFSGVRMFIVYTRGSFYRKLYHLITRIRPQMIQFIILGAFNMAWIHTCYWTRDCELKMWWSFFEQVHALIASHYKNMLHWGLIDQKHYVLREKLTFVFEDWRMNMYCTAHF